MGPASGCTIAGLQRQSGLDPVDARILLAHGLGLSRIQLITEAERELSAEQIQQVRELFQRRLQGEPVAYIIGSREFFGLALEVTPAVLIPRPETELLVELGAERLPPGGRALDLGTGSGAIAIALAHLRSDAAVSALDRSAEALAVARRNGQRHGVAVRFLQSDWYGALDAERFQLILSNPPYVRAGDAHLAEGDLRFEPIDALTDHGDGLSALRAIIGGAGARLEAGGWLLMEHGYDQAPAVRGLLREAGFGAVQSWADLAGIERVSGGRLDSPQP